MMGGCILQLEVLAHREALEADGSQLGYSN